MPALLVIEWRCRHLDETLEIEVLKIVETAFPGLFPLQIDTRDGVVSVGQPEQFSRAAVPEDFFFAGTNSARIPLQGDGAEVVITESSDHQLMPSTISIEFEAESEEHVDALFHDLVDQLGPDRGYVTSTEVLESASGPPTVKAAAPVELDLHRLNYWGSELCLRVGERRLAGIAREVSEFRSGSEGCFVRA